MYSFARHHHGLVWVTLSAILLFVHGCGSMSADNPAGNGAAAGANSVSPASDTLFSTIETPDFGRYDLVARDPGDGSGEWQFAVRSGRGAPTKNELRFVWDFGDGKTYEGVEQSYSFTTNGSYVIEVTAIKLDGTVAFLLTLNVEVAIVVNEPPSADAGTDQTADANALVFLYGGGSSDPDGDPLAYRWVQISGQPVLLLHADEPTASFITPIMSTDSDLVFGLTVGDGQHTGQATAVVHVLKQVQPAETLLVTADAGADQLNVLQGTPVTLDGHGSSSSNGSPLTYAWFWSPLHGTDVILHGTADPAIVTFTAPGLAQGETSLDLFFELVVSAGDQSASDEVRVTVTSELLSGGTDPQPIDPCASDPGCLRLQDVLLLLHLDGNAQDGSGRGNDGTLNGAVDCGLPGQFGNGCDFAQTNEYIELNDDLLEPSQLTVSLWVKFNSTGDWQDHRIYSHGKDWDTSEGLHLLHSRQTNKLLAQLAYGPNNTNLNISTSYTPQANTWYHLAVTYDANYQMAFYVDGDLVDTAQGSAPVYYSSTQSVRLGNGPGTNPGSGVNGLIDEVAVWGRALTATDIQQLAQVTSPSSVCGNGIIEDTEQCDGSNLGGQTCATRGFTGGTLACTASCTFDTGQCTSTPPGGDTTPPTVFVTAPTNGATVTGTIVVSATASDDVAVAGVQFKLDGANLGTEDSITPYSISWNTTSAANGSHTLTATAHDAAGNTTTSAPITITINNAPGDTTPPTTPTGLTTSGITASAITLSWTASTDNIGVTGYKVYRDLATTPIATVTGTSYQNTGLLPSTSYSYQVSAMDGAVPVNESGKSPSVSATTLSTPPGGTAPSARIYTPPNPLVIAPYTALFSGLDSTPPPGESIVRFDWNFGDSSSQDPQVDEGQLVAHRFDTPGTYTIGLTVTASNGAINSTSTQLTVSPFSGTTYYVDATLGNDANAGTTAAAPFQSLGRAFSVPRSTSHPPKILLKRGGTWRSSVPIGLPAPSIVSAYGSGERPIIELMGVSVALNGDWGDSIVLDGIHVRGTDYIREMVFPGGKGTVIRNSRMENGGISANYLKGVEGDLVVEDTEIDHTGAGWGMYFAGNDVVFRRNLVHDTASHGIYFNGGISDVLVAYSARWLIEGNTIRNSDRNCFNLFSVDGLVIRGNDASYCGFGGISLSVTPRAVAEENIVHDSVGVTGGMIFANLEGYGIIRNNLVYAISLWGITVGDHSYNGIAGNGDGALLIANNTVYQSSSASAFFLSAQPFSAAGRGRIMNNIFVQTGTGPVVQLDGADQIGQWIMNNNAYWTPNPAGNFFAPNGTLDLTGWRALVRGEANSVVTDPGFTAPASADFTLRAGSWPVDHGTTLREVFYDCTGRVVRPAGRACDIGAYEQ